jgi:hypothetical protein
MTYFGAYNTISSLNKSVKTIYREFYQNFKFFFQFLIIKLYKLYKFLSIVVSLEKTKNLKIISKFCITNEFKDRKTVENLKF